MQRQTRSTALTRIVGIALFCVLLAHASVAQPAESVRVTVPAAEINERADKRSAVMMTVLAGTVFEVLGKSGDWYWVVLPPDRGGTRRAGWITARSIEIFAGTQPAPALRDSKPKADVAQVPVQALPQAPTPAVTAPAAPQPAPQRATPRTNQTAAKRPSSYLVRISINVGAQPSSTTFAGSTTKAVYLESAVVNTTYGVGGGQSFDGGVLVRVAGNFGVGVAVSSFVSQQDGAVAATIPHPFFFNKPRSIAGTAVGLERNELVAHIQAAYLFSSKGKLDIALSGGPSFVSVKQGLVSDVTYAESYPYDTAAFKAAPSTTINASTVGFNVGADVGARLSKHVGVGGLVRFSRTSIEFPLAGTTTTVESNAGGVQVAGGLRLFF